MVKNIIKAIENAEKDTSGEIRVHLKQLLIGDAFKEAKKKFYALGMQRTRHRNGVLILVALKSKKFAIFGDEGIHQKVGDDFWDETRDKIAAYFSKGQIEAGLVAGVESVGEKLRAFFPVEAQDKNELSNEVTDD